MENNSKLFYILSKLSGVLVFVLMGFSVYSLGEYSINGWHTISFSLGTAMIFASIFALLIILISICLILIGYICQLALKNSEDKDSFAFVCKKLNEKYAFSDWGRWLFLAEFIFSICYLICISVYINQLNDSLLTISASMLLMPYLLLIFFGIFTYFVFIHPLVKKHEKKDSLSASTRTSNTQKHKKQNGKSIESNKKTTKSKNNKK